MGNSDKKLLYVASTASHLRRFHMPYIQTLKKDAQVVTMADGEGVDFAVRFDKSFFSIANLRSIFKIRKILRQEKFDVVLLHTTLAAFLVRAAMFGLKRRPYVMNVVHGYLFSQRLGGMKDRILLLCEKMLRSKTDDIAVMNAEDEKIAAEHKLCRGNVFFLSGMGITISEEVPIQDQALRRRYAPNPNDFVCTFVGELSKRKNQAFLIHAAQKLRSMGIPVRLLLLGDGAEREELEGLIQTLGVQEYVILAGNCEPILPYLSITDLYVSASRSEGLPFNVMEAMSAGLPIVASDTKGQTDLLAQYAGCLYPLDDMEAFCNAVQSVYASKKYGVGSVSYPTLEQFRLRSVFADNMKILTLGLNQNENRN